MSGSRCGRSRLCARWARKPWLNDQQFDAVRAKSCRFLGSWNASYHSATCSARHHPYRTSGEDTTASPVA